MGKRGPRKRQSSMWVASSELPRSAGNPFYERLNRVLDEAGFDAFVEEQWAKFYADSLGPAEPGAGLAARRFAEPSTIPGLSSCTKPRRIDLETHQAGAAWVSSTRGGHRRCPCRPYPAPACMQQARRTICAVSGLFIGPAGGGVEAARGGRRATKHAEVMIFEKDRSVNSAILAMHVWR